MLSIVVVVLVVLVSVADPTAVLRAPLLTALRHLIKHPTQPLGTTVKFWKGGAQEGLEHPHLQPQWQQHLQLLEQRPAEAAHIYLK
jgi:hypothetical protein